MKSLPITLLLLSAAGFLFLAKRVPLFYPGNIQYKIKNTAIEPKQQALFDTVCKLYILYPRVKEDKSFFLFLNGKQVSQIKYGERLAFDFGNNSNVLTVIQETDKYVEPNTSSKNSRNIFLKDGKEYFLRINGKGQLEYVADVEEGLKLLNDNNRYITPLNETKFSN